jgi:hypothetical protein
MADKFVESVAAHEDVFMPSNDIKLSGEEEGAQRLTTSPLQRVVRPH